MTVDEQIKANAETASALLEAAKVLKHCGYISIGGFLVMLITGTILLGVRREDEVDRSISQNQNLSFGDPAAPSRHRDWLTAQEAGVLAGVNPDTMRERCATGLIAGAVKVDGLWRVPKDFRERVPE